MTDVIDTANDLADSEREALVARELARGHTPRATPVHATDGRRLCIACGVPIDQKRLAAVPHAVACTECEQANEQQQQLYRRASPWAR